MKSLDESLIFYQEAINLIDNNDYGAALKCIKKNFDILVTDDDMALANLNCGFLNIKLKDYNSAIHYFTASIDYEIKLESLNGRSRDLPFNGRSDSRYKNGDFKGAIEDKIVAREIRLIEEDKYIKSNKIYIDYKNILLGSFDEIDLGPANNLLIKASKKSKSKYDLISDYKKVINTKKKEEIINKLEILFESKYRIGDFKGSIKAIRRSEKYL